MLKFDAFLVNQSVYLPFSFMTLPELDSPFFHSEEKCVELWPNGFATATREKVGHIVLFCCDDFCCL